MKLINIMSKASSSSIASEESSHSKGRFSLGNLFRRRSSNVSSKSYSSNDENSYRSSNSVFDSETMFEEQQTPELEEEQEPDEYDPGFETDDLTSIDSMEIQSLMSEPQFKQFNGYKTVVHPGRNITRDWEMRYDNLIGQFYYINKADSSLTMNSPQPITNF